MQYYNVVYYNVYSLVDYFACLKLKLQLQQNKIIYRTVYINSTSNTRIVVALVAVTTSFPCHSVVIYFIVAVSVSFSLSVVRIGAPDARGSIDR